MEKLTVDIQPVSYFKFDCPRCGTKIVIRQKTRCNCGLEWQIEVRAIAVQDYKVGPSEVK